MDLFNLVFGIIDKPTLLAKQYDKYYMFYTNMKLVVDFSSKIVGYYWLTQMEGNTLLDVSDR